MSSTAKPSHVTESIADRKKSRELAEARQNGAVAPEVDVKTGNMINPHNPEFITKRPWYLGNNDEGPSLDHQADPGRDQLLLSMQSADAVLKQERDRLKDKRKKGLFEVGMWVEALKNNKSPYRICQIIKIAKKGTVYDLKYEDGTIERKVKFKPKKGTLNMKPRIRMTKTGARSIQIDESKHGKETYDSKRDTYHGYSHETHTKRVEAMFKEREEIRRQLREKKRLAENEQGDDDDGGGGGKATEGGEKNKTGNGKSNDKKKKVNDNSDSDLDSDVEDDDDSDDEFVQRDEDARVVTTRLARQGGVGGAQMKVTARNLRIREDTAKYLRNLDPNSAYYDPKSRSMRDNPNPEIPADELQFAGDNFARISGDAVKLAETQLFAWDATEKGAGNELHPQANPSQVEVLKKKFQTKSAQLQVQKKKKVLDKYGGSEYLDGTGGLASAVDASSSTNANAASNRQSTKKNSQRDISMAQERKIRFGVSTVAEEYSRDGRLLKGLAKNSLKQQHQQADQKSKYEEDVFINGHTTVWGSYFHIGAFQWGYDDDHSLLKNSYCTGENGRRANDEANEMRYGTGVAGSAALAQARGMLKAMPQYQRQQQQQQGGGGKQQQAPPHMSRSKLYGEADQKVILDPEKVKQALLEKRKGRHDDHHDDDGNADANQEKKKRKFNSINANNIDVSAEEMEAYRLTKERNADPMAKISNDELLEY